MIRYRTTLQALERRIDRKKAGWRAEAAARTADLRALGKYDDKPGNWSEIKEAYMDLQHNKCAYCERKLAGPGIGNYEHDVEHFRPKSSIKKWPGARRGDPKYDFGTGAESTLGYYLLAYNVLNYATACKPCNSGLKSNYFPVAGPRDLQSDDPRTMAGEKAFLIYPLSAFDDDPEELITFNGPAPMPKAADPTRARRARVIIDFFRLDVRREDLIEERSKIIHAMRPHLRTMTRGSSPEEGAEAEESLRFYTANRSEHASCARAYAALYLRDSAGGEAIYRACHAYLKSKYRHIPG